MRVNPVTLNGGRYFLNLPNGIKNSVEADLTLSNITDLSAMPYIYPINFTATQNSSKLRVLFSYGLPCMYTGVPMIDPKSVNKMIKSQAFNRTSEEAVKSLQRFRNSLSGNELKFFNILEERSKIHPEKTIKELLKEVSPIFQRDLRKKQSPIFFELSEIFKTLEPEYQKQFNILMTKTEKQLDEKPVLIPFSSFEFKYKLSKIRDDILKNGDLKAKKTINKMIKESKKLADSTNHTTFEHQKQVIGMLDWIRRKSVLKDNEQLRNLIYASKSRLHKEEIIVPFSRKAFIYDLARIVHPINNPELEEKILEVALKLPTSSQDFSAYFLKIALESPEKIVYRLLWPSMASVEHIHPRSCGGKDALANYGGATTRANSTRKSMDFADWININPDIPKHCQEYVDRLVELYYQKVFAKHGISPKYITDFAKAIYNESKGRVKLDTRGI